MIKHTLQQLIDQIKAHNDSHKMLTLSHLNLDDDTVIPLISIINNNPNIRNLDLSFNLITNKGAQALNQLQHINHLNLRANQLTDQGIAAFYGNQCLTHLILDLNMNVNDQAALDLVKQSQLLELQLMACSVSTATKHLIKTIIEDRMANTQAANDDTAQSQRRSLFLDELA